MKNLSLFLIAILLWNCASRSTTENTSATTDSLITTASVVSETTDTSTAEYTTSLDEEQAPDGDEVYGEIGDDFQGDYDDSNALSRQDENGMVHFVTSRDYESQAFPVSLFNENDNPVEDVPAYLNSKGIKYSLEKIEASSDPEDYESTDVYTYTFGESVIQISYGNVNEATIYSPEIELQDGVKVGMTKEDFLAVFPQVQEYTGIDEFRLHPYAFAQFCYMTFYFQDGKISSITLTIAPQDCG
ncbi:MAG TPA: hypothetical protein VGK59_19280 [Ohtaekwangia sp.]